MIIFYKFKFKFNNLIIFYNAYEIYKEPYNYIKLSKYFINLNLSLITLI